MIAIMKKENIKIVAFVCALMLLGCSVDIPANINSIQNEEPDVTGPVNSGTIDFTKTYGGTKNESARSIISTLDGGYAVLGFTQSMDGDITDKTDESHDYWLMKFSAQNTLEWNKTYGGSDNDRANDIIQTKDGGYIVIGSSFSMDGDVSGNPDNLGNDDYWVIKLDPMGNISWNKTFGFIGSDKGFSVLESSVGGYFIVGVLDVTASGGEGNTFSSNANAHAGGDYWGIKLSDTGEIEWSKFYGGNFSDTPESMIETEDNGYLIMGSSDSVDVDITGNYGSYDYWAVKISSTGTLEWERSYGGTEIDEAFGIVKTDDGNYMVSGVTRSSDNNVSLNKGGADVWLNKISPSGELLWEKSYGGSDFDVSTGIVKAQAGDKGYIITGSSRSQDGDATLNQGQNDAWIIKISSDGELEWENSVGGSDIDFFYDAVQLQDGSIIAVGESFSNDGSIPENKGFSDLLLTKIK